MHLLIVAHDLIWLLNFKVLRLCRISRCNQSKKGTLFILSPPIKLVFHLVDSSKLIADTWRTCFEFGLLFHCARFEIGCGSKLVLKPVGIFGLHVRGLTERNESVFLLESLDRLVNFVAQVNVDRLRHHISVQGYLRFSVSVSEI